MAAWFAFMSAFLYTFEEMDHNTMRETKGQPPFTGFSTETFDFLAQIALHNDKAYFLAHREDYERWVKQPLLALEAAVSPTVIEIDPGVRTGPRALSRIYRDTRFSKDKSPLRDHAWIAYRPPDKHLSECFCYYFEITPVSYGYGLGMYDSHPAFMADLRARAAANPARFDKVLGEERIWDRFELSGEDYARPKVPDAPPPLDKLINKRYFSLIHHSTNLAATYTNALADEIAGAFALLAPLYHLITGMEA